MWNPVQQLLVRKKCKRKWKSHFLPHQSSILHTDHVQCSYWFLQTCFKQAYFQACIHAIINLITSLKDVWLRKNNFMKSTISLQFWCGKIARGKCPLWRAKWACCYDKCSHCVCAVDWYHFTFMSHPFAFFVSQIVGCIPLKRGSTCRCHNALYASRGECTGCSNYIVKCFIFKKAI